MSCNAVLPLIAAWAVWGIVLGIRTSEVIILRPAGWAVMLAIWAACGPLAGVLARR